MDSYAVEANKLGTWKDIGYTAPGATATGTSGSTTNFKYEPVAADPAESWKATSLTALNDCKLGSQWTVVPSRSSSTGIVTYLASLTGGSTGDCATLTPNFGKLSSNQSAGTITAQQ